LLLDLANPKTLLPIGYNWSLKPFSLALEAGKTTVLQGDNGSGKSNLLKLLSGVLMPGYGINSFLTAGDTPIRTSGFFQPIPFDPQLSLDRNQKLWGITPYQSDQTGDYQKNLERLGLMQYLTTKWGAASSGMRQKFGVAMALARKADLYFLDEPLAHVDASSIETITEMVREKLSEGSAILITTHQARSWSLDFDHYYHMTDGAISQHTQEG
jgi:ABC-2 type transport system ATP-binding protein